MIDECFLPAHGSSFLLIVSFEAQKGLTLLKPSLSIFSFVACDFGVLPKTSLPNPLSHSYSPMVPPKSLIVLGLGFRSSDWL